MEVLKNKRYLALAGIVLLFLGCIFPYFQYSIFGIKYTLSLIKYWEGYVIILCAVATALFVFKDFVEKYVPNLFNSGLLGKIKDANPKLVLIPIGIAALVAIYLTFSIDIDKSIIKHGLGFWLTWLGVIALVAHVFIYKGEAGAQAAVGAPMQQPMMNNNMNQGMNYQQPTMPQDMNYQNQQMNQGMGYQQQPMMNNNMNQGMNYQQPTSSQDMNNQYPNNNNQF